jgi:hypothetical protein
VVSVVGVLVPHGLGGPQAEDRQDGHERQDAMQTGPTTHDLHGSAIHDSGQAREATIARPGAQSERPLLRSRWSRSPAGHNQAKCGVAHGSRLGVPRPTESRTRRPRTPSRPRGAPIETRAGLTTGSPGAANSRSAALVNGTPAIRHRGRRPEEPPGPGTACRPGAAGLSVRGCSGGQLGAASSAAEHPPDCGGRAVMVGHGSGPIGRLSTRLGAVR